MARKWRHWLSPLSVLMLVFALGLTPVAMATPADNDNNSSQIEAVAVVFNGNVESTLAESPPLYTNPVLEPGTGTVRFLEFQELPICFCSCPSTLATTYIATLPGALKGEMVIMKFPYLRPAVRTRAFVRPALLGKYVSLNANTDATTEFFDIVAITEIATPDLVPRPSTIKSSGKLQSVTFDQAFPLSEITDFSGIDNGITIAETDHSLLAENTGPPASNADTVENANDNVDQGTNNAAFHQARWLGTQGVTNANQDQETKAAFVRNVAAFGNIRVIDNANLNHFGFTDVFRDLESGSKVTTRVSQSTGLVLAAAQGNVAAKSSGFAFISDRKSF
jgi:hypothetical protein